MTRELKQLNDNVFDIALDVAWVELYEWDCPSFLVQLRRWYAVAVRKRDAYLVRRGH